MTSIQSSLPAEWREVRFGEIAKIINDRIETPNLQSDLQFYIGLDDLDTDQIRIKRFGFTKDITAPKYLCKKGDIIFGKRNAYLRKVSISDRDAVVSGHSMVLRPKGSLIYDKFLSCLMQSNLFWKTAHSISEGSMSPTIKWKILEKQKFIIPSIPEQKKISEILWAIEENIEKTEKLLETTEKLKKGLLNQLLTKGTGHTKFKETEIGEIPEEWELKKISSISKVRRGASPRPIDDKSYFSENGPGWIRIGDLTGIYKYLNKTSQYLSEKGVAKSVPVKKGDLIMSICATIGKPIIINMEACIHDGFVLFEDIDNSIYPEFIFYFLLSNEEYFKSLKQEGTQGNLNTKIVGDVYIPIPFLEEQKIIINIFNKIDNTIETYKSHITHLSNLKKKLTNELLSGNIRIPPEVLENVQ